MRESALRRGRGSEINTSAFKDGLQTMKSVCTWCSKGHGSRSGQGVITLAHVRNSSKNTVANVIGVQRTSCRARFSCLLQYNSVLKSVTAAFKTGLRKLARRESTNNLGVYSTIRT